jgi:hypothetical protein
LRVKGPEYDLLRESWEYLVAIGPRCMGTEGEKQAVRYLLAQLQDLGAAPVTQAFPYEGWSVSADASLHMTVPFVKEIESYLLLGSGQPVGAFVEGKVCVLGETIIWNMYSWPRFGIIDQHNTIVGYITGRPTGAAISQTLAEGNSRYPHFSIGAEDTELLLALLKQGKEIHVRGTCATQATGLQEGVNIRVPSRNVPVAEKKIVLCAHYDTMYNTKGAYDNTSGVAVLLSLLKILQDRQWRKPIEIIFMAGEEWRLAGSSAHVKALTPQEIAEIELVINVDGIGRGNVFEAWLGPEEVEHEMYRFFAQRTADASRTFAVKTPPPPGSDHTPFYDAGVPACMFTINDQDIIHSPRDVIDERIYENMVYCVQLLVALLEYKRAIL